MGGRQGFASLVVVLVKRSPLPPRKTPLARGTKEIARSALKRSTKRIPARSQKREAIAQERRDFVARILVERPWCEAHATLVDLALISGPLRARPVDVHELRRRSQGSPIVPSQGLADDDVLALCRACHEWIGANPREAVSLGLARWGMRAGEADFG